MKTHLVNWCSPKLKEDPALNPIGVSLHKSCLQSELTSYEMDVV